MSERAVATVFLRNGADVLLRTYDGADGDEPRWTTVTGDVGGDPDVAAREAIQAETDLDPETGATLVRRGEPFDAADPEGDGRRTVYPYLFDSESRRVGSRADGAEWVPPPAILRRETVPGLWRAYDRVRPSPATIDADREHGSAYLSVRALEVLRDEAALAADRSADDDAPIREVARALVEARPSMPAIATRVDRVVATAENGEAVLRAVEQRASEASERALAADDAAARNAASRLAADRVATCSRSGTVSRALELIEPESVLVAESRPGGEGRDVARSLAEEGADVTLAPDAAMAARFAAGSVDALLVGADAILPDGRVVNKVGTRGLAIAAAYEGIDVAIVAASDKVTSEEEPTLETHRGSECCDHPGVERAAPLFDVMPPDAIDVLATDRGCLAPAEVEPVAAEHRRLSAWRR